VQSGHQALGRARHYRRKTDDRGVTKVVKHYDSFVITAEIDGNFDKRGLPDPLVLAFYFTLHDDLIVPLIILRNRRDI
jgi:hypothetical protein